MLFKQAFSIQTNRYNEYELNVNNNDDFTIFFDHKKGIINIKNKKFIYDLKEITKMYADDYFDNATKETLQYALLFIESIAIGSFEYDTHSTDCLLSAFKQALNKVDI
jgi:hypothetical protein